MVVADNKRIAKNTIFLYMRMIFVLLVSLYTTRVVLNSLGVDDFGIYNVVAGFVTMFGFLNTSLSNGIQRFYNYTLGKEGVNGLKIVYNSALVIQTALSVLIIILLETVGLWYVEEKMVIAPERLTVALYLFQFSTFSLVLLMLQIPFSASIMAHERMDFYALVSMISAGMRLVIAIILPLVPWDKLLFYGFLLLCVSVIEFLMYFIYSKRNFQELSIEIKGNKKLLFSMLSFSGWNVFGTFAFMLKAQGLTVLLNVFFGTAINAAQGIATQIQNALYGFSGNVVTAFRPQLVQSYASGNFDRVRTMFYSLSKISFILLFMLSVPVAYEANYILNIWLGDNIPGRTVSFTILILANMVLSSLHAPLTQIIHASGKMKKFQITTSLIMCMIIPISWVMLELGCIPESVYWVSFCIQLVNQISCMVVVKGVMDFSFSNYISKVVIPCFIMLLVVPSICLIPQFILEESFIRLITTSLLSLLTTFSLLYFYLSTESEKELINKIIISKIK